MKMLLAAALVLSAGCPAIAQQEGVPSGPITGNQFDLVFTDPESRAIGLMATAKAISGDRAIGTLICFQAGVTYLQAAKIIDRYMETNPRVLNMPMHDIAVLAMYDAYPCPK